MRHPIRLGGLSLAMVLACADDVTTNDEVGDTEETSSMTDSTEDSSSESETESESTTESESETDSESTTESEGETTESDTESSDTSESETESESTTESESDTDTGADAICGDGVVHPDEVCDDGNDISADGCEVDCTYTATIEWVVVRDSLDAPCSSIRRMALRPDGDIATVGGSKDGIQTSKLFVATWDVDNGEILAEFMDDSSVSDLANKPNLDILPEGDIYVSRSVESELGSPTGAVWRLGPDLELEWMRTAKQISPVDQFGPPVIYKAVLALPDGGALLLGNSGHKLQRIDAQGQFVTETFLFTTTETVDMSMVDGQAWIVRQYQQFGQYWARLERFDPQLVVSIAETIWGIDGNRDMTEIEHHAGRTVVVGNANPDNPDSFEDFPGLWSFDADGTLIDTSIFTQLGPVIGDGMAIADDGTIIVAATHAAFGVSPEGKLLWHVAAEDVELGARFGDALFDAQGNAYVGGWVFVDFDCSEALLARVSWPGQP